MDRGMSSDHFAAMGETRRPWLDLEALKAKFLARSGKEHPDRVHQAGDAERAGATDRFAELNAAYRCLREPRDRLAHLIELETGTRPRDVQRIPPGTMDLFAEVGQMCQSVDAFLAERDRVTSPIVRVSWLQRSADWADQVQQLERRIVGRRAQLWAELEAMNGAWDSAPPVGDSGRSKVLSLERLEQVYRALGYAHRWIEQLEERRIRLSL
jgi:DnaJ-domain-containing protein 1